MDTDTTITHDPRRNHVVQQLARLLTPIIARPGGADVFLCELLTVLVADDEDVHEAIEQIGAFKVATFHRAIGAGSVVSSAWMLRYAHALAVVERHPIASALWQAVGDGTIDAETMAAVVVAALHETQQDPEASLGVALELLDRDE